MKLKTEIELLIKIIEIHATEAYKEYNIEKLKNKNADNTSYGIGVGLQKAITLIKECTTKEIIC